MVTISWLHLTDLHLGQRDERVMARLARLIREDEDDAVKDAAYHALLALAKAPEKQGTPHS